MFLTDPVDPVIATKEKIPLPSDTNETHTGRISIILAEQEIKKMYIMNNGCFLMNPENKTTARTSVEKKASLKRNREMKSKKILTAVFFVIFFLFSIVVVLFISHIPDMIYMLRCMHIIKPTNGEETSFRVLILT